MIELLSRPWPWWVAGPLVGLMAPLLLLIGNRPFGMSSNLRHLCAALWPRDVAFFRYDWKAVGLWNLVLLAGVVVGGLVGGVLLGSPEPVRLSAGMRAELAALGLSGPAGLVPPEIYAWPNLFSARGLVFAVGGGLLIGFGSAYAGGCTSGHGISGLADLQLPSLIAVVALFGAGILTSLFALPFLLEVLP